MTAVVLFHNPKCGTSRNALALLRELDAGADDETLLAAAIVQPILIERPIVETDKGAVIGRPPERVLEVL